MKLLIIGGSGLVGSNIVRVASARGDDVYATYHSTKAADATVRLDKTDADRTIDLVEDVAPDVIVDTAAFHAVDDCETERARAWDVNAAGTHNVAVAANAVDAHLVYLSTDYVFPGVPGDAPYVESDPVSPLNYYGEAKYAGECAARIADTVTVVRPSVIYGLAQPNFVTWALGELEAGNEVTIVDDQVSTPTYAPDIARACLALADNTITGLYHATGPHSLSRYEFTIRLAKAFSFETEWVTPITTEEFGQEAPRPADSSLDSSRLYDRINQTFSTPTEAFEIMRSER